MTLRAILEHVVISASDVSPNTNVVALASVTVYEEDGTTLLTQPMYSAASGGTVLTNPLTANGQGFVKAYADQAQRVVLKVNGVSYPSAFTHDPVVVRPVVNVKGKRARGNNIDDDTTPFVDAVTDAVATGAPIHVPAGTYRLETVVADGVAITLNDDTLTIQGDGRTKSVLRAGTAFSGGVIGGTGVSKISVLDVKLVGEAAGWIAKIDGDGDATDITFERVDVDDEAGGLTSGQGAIQVIGMAAGGRLTFRDVLVTQSAGDQTGNGIYIGSIEGTPSYDLVFDHVVTEGFLNGLTNSSTGTFHRVQVNNCEFRGAGIYGASLYHCGEATITGCVFRDNARGLYLDTPTGEVGNDDDFGPGRPLYNKRPVVTGCRFLNNGTIGMVLTQSAGVVLAGTIFDSNLNGLWVQGGRDVVVSGGIFRKNSDTGILLSAGEILGVSPENDAQLESILLSGIEVVNNGGHGIIAKGVRRTLTLAGCNVTNNGLSNTFDPPNSGYASVLLDLDVDEDADPVANLSFPGPTFVYGGTYGNTEQGAAHGQGSEMQEDGNQQYGFLSTVSHGGLTILGAAFLNLEDPISTANGTVVVHGCHFESCEDGIDAGAGTLVWGANTGLDRAWTAPAGLTLAGLLTVSTGGASIVGNVELRSAAYLQFNNAGNTESARWEYDDTGNTMYSPSPVKSNQKVLAVAGLGVGNSAAAGTPGTVVKKMEVFDASGASLGFVAIYDAIT